MTRRRLLLSLGAIVLLALNWAAAHDILKENEPSYVMEYAVLIVSSLGIAGFMIPKFLRRPT